MKKIYALSVMFFVITNMTAQLTLTKTNNAPIVGYKYANNYYDSTTAVPKLTGTNKNWNFSSFAFDFGTSYGYTYVPANSTPYSSNYPTANLALTNGGNGYEYFNSQTNSFEEVGFSTGNYSYTVNDPLQYMFWPMSYGNSNTDYFDLVATSSTQATSFTGFITTNATGTGTVTLPGGQKFNSCLQVTQTWDYVSSGSDSYTVHIIEYQYWTGSYRSPIMSIQYSTEKSASGTSKYFSIQANQYADVGVEENELIENGFVVFPNPAKEKLNVMFKNDSVADEMELHDASGKTILSEQNTNALDVSKLSKGIYILKMRNKNSFVQKQVIITE